MRIIKVDATDSTNSFAKELYKDSLVNRPTCIVAHQQTVGRGQRGAVWQSNAGENLTFSVIYPKMNLKADRQFLITATVAIALLEALKTLNINKLNIKWPNDIMASGRKIAGILIENYVSNGSTTTSIIGIGLNVNQEAFVNLPKAASLRMLTGNYFELHQVLEICLNKIENALNNLKENTSEALINQYHEYLFNFKKTSTFQLPNKDYFVGVIEGVSPTGKLRVQTEGDTVQEFDIKGIRLCF